MPLRGATPTHGHFVLSPVSLALRDPHLHLRSHGKIGDCEQSRALKKSIKDQRALRPRCTLYNCIWSTKFDRMTVNVEQAKQRPVKMFLMKILLPPDKIFSRHDIFSNYLRKSHFNFRSPTLESMQSMATETRL